MENDSYNSNVMPIKKDYLSCFEHIVNHMPGGFFIYRACGDEEILHVNSAMLRIFGCDTLDEFKELTGYTFKGMVHPDDIDEVEKSIAEQIQNSVYDLDNVEYRIKQKDGSTRWVIDYGHFVHTENYGDIFYVFISDDTERIQEKMKEIEKVNKELKSIYEKEKQYRKAVLYNSSFFFEVNLSKNEFITNITHNDEGHIFDYLFDRYDMTENKNYSKFVSLLLKQVEQSEFEKCKNFFDIERLLECYKNNEFEQEYKGWIHDNFGRKYLIHYIALIGKNESSNQFIALIMAKDITEQTKKQEVLKFSLYQAQVANIAKNTFLANMSHDIRTPLNAILGFTELIGINKKDLDKVEDYLNKLKISAKQLLSIVDKVLEITRIEPGKSVLVERECYLIDFINDVENSMLPEMRAKNIDFKIDSSNIKNFGVYIDTIRTKEVLCQILDNAAKYTNLNGEVKLTVTENDFMGGYGKYSFIIEDNGIGISDDFKEHMFEPFTREKNTTKSGIPGSGLGMTVVKSIVDMMEGEIDFESHIGVGTKFVVSFILKQIKSDLYLNQPLESISLKGKRVLLVEDNEINSEIARELLSEQEYVVEIANDGDVGVEMVKNSQPGYYDFVLMDIQMPRMNGYDATRAIRSLEDTKLSNVPIIALSANTYAEDQKKSLDAGMDAHFSKPIIIEDLQKLIRNVLERRTDC